MITLRARKSTHPWLNDCAVALVDAMRAAQGTLLERERTLACSAGLAAECHDYIVRTDQKMRELEPSSKLWWKKAKEVKVSSIQDPTVFGYASSWNRFQSVGRRTVPWKTMFLRSILSDRWPSTTT